MFSYLEGLKNIPLSLIVLRLLFGFIILALAVFPVSHHQGIIIILFTAGLLSDVFDGIIARKLNVSTVRLRRLDSAIDQIFWVLVFLSAIIICPQFFQQHLIELSILLCLEALTYIISFIRFRKEVATHAISSKIWTLLLFATLVQVVATCHSGWLFQVFLYAGIITRLEIVAILFLLRHWTNDVPSMYHAFQLRNGKPIKRHKLFNG